MEQFIINAMVWRNLDGLEEFVREKHYSRWKKKRIKPGLRARERGRFWGFASFHCCFRIAQIVKCSIRKEITLFIIVFFFCQHSIIKFQRKDMPTWDIKIVHRLYFGQGPVFVNPYFSTCFHREERQILWCHCQLWEGRRAILILNLNLLWTTSTEVS